MFEWNNLHGGDMHERMQMSVLNSFAVPVLCGGHNEEPHMKVRVSKCKLFYL